jgi:hypothetical protein
MFFYLNGNKHIKEKKKMVRGEIHLPVDAEFGDLSNRHQAR